MQTDSNFHDDHSVARGTARRCRSQLARLPQHPANNWRWRGGEGTLVPRLSDSLPAHREWRVVESHLLIADCSSARSAGPGLGINGVVTGRGLLR